MVRVRASATIAISFFIFHLFELGLFGLFRSQLLSLLGPWMPRKGCLDVGEVCIFF